VGVCVGMGVGVGGRRDDVGCGVGVGGPALGVAVGGPALGVAVGGGPDDSGTARRTERAACPC
jgi:hypothetical protein